MRVILAGYNVDSSVLEELKKNCPPREDITPETLSAAYARISRDPRSVDKLREVARAEVGKARRSNQNIIFKMGHHSVAEHAVFNFDIIGISRLALEELEKFRLSSYTEKSQRYIKLADDHIVPQEITEAGKIEAFKSLIKSQNDLYHSVYEKLKPYFYDTCPELAAQPNKHSVLNGLAMEDARYVLSLATLGQLGMTVNARNLEHMIRRFAGHALAEIREMNRKLFELARQVAPSILLFTQANDFDSLTYRALAEQTRRLLPRQPQKGVVPVHLAAFTPEPDVRLLAALLHSTSLHPYAVCLKKARSLAENSKRDLVKSALERMEFYDSVLREFEHVDLTFELVVSATCFAQLKRHRMATLTAQAYSPDLGVVVPPSIKAVGAEVPFLGIMERTQNLYTDLKQGSPHGAEYVLSNAHCKRVLWKANAREFYHFSRLREDATAQWDIRNVAAEMTRLACQVMPLTLLLIGGKDAYPEIYRSVFGKSPRLLPPLL